MNWIKRGRIFDPTDHTLTNNCVEYAQAPQVLVFDDFVRIYFSSRTKDVSGKYLSHISYVDMEKDLHTIRDLSSQTIIPLGDLGSFDEHGIFPFNVIRVKNKVYGYISGINRKLSVPIDTAIGLAISEDDGSTFTRIGMGPILASSLHEPAMIGDPFVMRCENTFHMFYIFAVRWIRNAEKDGAPARVYKIAHAVSDDGITWMRDSKLIIPDVLNSDECQAIPTVAYISDQYHMYFCFRQAIDFRNNKNNSYRIGYAKSNDLVEWIRDDSKVGIDISKEGWDSEMMCYPHIFNLDGTWYLLYNGNEFGRFGFGLAKLIDSE